MRANRDDLAGLFGSGLMVGNGVAGLGQQALQLAELPRGKRNSLFHLPAAAEVAPRAQLQRNHRIAAFLRDHDIEPRVVNARTQTAHRIGFSF